MPNFQYTAQDQTGATQQGVVEADDQNDAYAKVTASGLTPTAIAEAQQTTPGAASGKAKKGGLLQIEIGGGATKALVNQCRPRLPIGGRLVVHGVTMEAEMLVETLHCDLGGDLIRFGVETADVIGRLHGWKPARTVVAWTWQRTE